MIELRENDCLYALRELSRDFKYSNYHTDHSQAYFTPRVVRDFLYERSGSDRQADEQRQIVRVENILENAIEKAIVRKVTTVVSISSDVRRGYKLTTKGKKVATEIEISEERLKKLKEKIRRPEEKGLSFP